MVVIRYLFVLLIGALLGAFGVSFALQKGYGDFFIKNAPAVADLERRLDGMEQERNRLGRQLESVEGRAAKMEKLFAELEGRFRGLQDGGTPPPAGTTVPAPDTPPSTAAVTPPAADAATTTSTVPPPSAAAPTDAAPDTADADTPPAAP